MRHYLVTYTEHNGDYEYINRLSIAREHEITMRDAIVLLLWNELGDEESEDEALVNNILEAYQNNGFIDQDFNDRGYSRIGWEEITENEYDVLQKFYI